MRAKTITRAIAHTSVRSASAQNGRTADALALKHDVDIQRTIPLGNVATMADEAG
jgi:hypothetical protein